MISKLIVLSSNDNKFLTTLDTPLHLDKECEIALQSLEMYYCFPNITKDNNVFRYSNDSGQSWKKIYIPIGCYTLDTLYIEIVEIIGNKGKDFTFSSLTSRVKTIVNITNPNFQIDFGYSKSFGKLLGFNSIIKDNYNESEESINLLNINSIFVKTNLTETSIYNEKHIPFIYSFFPNALPGDKIVECPNNLIYHKLITNRIHNFEVSLVDENDKHLDFNGETVTIRLHLRSRC